MDTSIAFLLLAFFCLISIASLFYKQQVYPSAGKLKKIAVLIPGYKEDEVIIEVAKSALQQKYALNLFDVIVIADSFQEETITKLKTLALPQSATLRLIAPKLLANSLACLITKTC
mgnify:CR=1 FL=1